MTHSVEVASTLAMMTFHSKKEKNEMKQQVKILESYSSAILEMRINEFVSEYEVRDIQLIITPLGEMKVNSVLYTALIKYQVHDSVIGADFDEVNGR